jgi:flagellar biosynthesis protein FlhF
VHDEVLRTFDRTPLKGCILSKVDEAMSLGGLLSLLIQKQLPLAYIANGQRVPEDLHPARGKDLVNRAAQLAEQLRVGTDHETLAQRFGGIAANAHI